MENNIDKNQEEVTRKDAIKKIRDYGRYLYLSELGTYMLLNPQKSKASSPIPNPGDGFY